MTNLLISLIDLLIQEIGAATLHAKIDERAEILAARAAADLAEKALTGQTP